MENNRSIARIIFLTVAVLLCAIIGIHEIPGIRMERNFRAGLSRLEQEVETTPVYVTHKRRVNIHGASFNIGDIIEKSIGTQFWDCKVVFVDARVWFVYILRLSDGNTWTINVASVTREGKDFQTHYCTDSIIDQTNGWSPMNIHCRRTYYSDEWCYYYEGKIVLTDRVTIFEYDLLTGAVKEHDYASYRHPVCAYDADISDRNKIVISTSYDDRIITPEKASTTSTSFAAMMEFANMDIWDRTPSFQYFFDSVQYDGRELYIICRILSYYGESYAVVFRYDYMADRLSYCFSQHTGGPIEENLYIVPTA